MASEGPQTASDMIDWEYGDAIDASVVADFEATKGIELPASFKSIVVGNDGSVPYPAGVAFADPTRPMGYDVVGIGQLHRFVEQEGAGWSIAEANDAYAEAYPGLVFFSEAGNGWGFAFDYRSARADPPVVLVRFGQGGGDVVPVASSFDAMLAAVLEDGERPVVVSGA